MVEQGEEVLDLNLDVLTQSATGLPGIWSEEELFTLLNAWEEVVDAPRIQSPGKPFDMADKVLEILTNSGFRHVERDDVVKQMSTLRKYRTYLGLVKAGIPTINGNCVPQLQRIMRKATTRKGRRRRTSTTSNQMDGVSEDDTANQNGQSQPESTEETATRTKRVRFQRQTLQRSIRTMISQQRTVMDYLQDVFNKIDESNSKMIALLGELVTLQKNPNYIELN